MIRLKLMLFFMLNWDEIMNIGVLKFANVRIRLVLGFIKLKVKQV